MKPSEYLLLLAGLVLASGLTILAALHVGRSFSSGDVFVKTERFAFCVDAEHVIDLANAKTNLEKQP